MTYSFCCRDCHVFLEHLTQCPHCGSRNTAPVSEAGDIELQEPDEEEAEAEECDCCCGSGECPSCGGDGYQSVECECCGQDTTTDCESCEGSCECVDCDGTGESQGLSFTNTTSG